MIFHLFVKVANTAQDIVDLRKKNWHFKGGVLKGPTTLDEVRAQVSSNGVLS